MTDEDLLKQVEALIRNCKIISKYRSRMRQMPQKYMFLGEWVAWHKYYRAIRTDRPDTRTPITVKNRRDRYPLQLTLVRLFPGQDKPRLRNISY